LAVDGWKEGDGSDEVQVVRGYYLFVSHYAGRVGEKKRKGEVRVLFVK
jgi:hypothetical protein